MFAREPHQYTEADCYVVDLITESILETSGFWPNSISRTMHPLAAYPRISRAKIRLRNSAISEDTHPYLGSFPSPTASSFTPSGSTYASIIFNLDYLSLSDLKLDRRANNNWIIGDDFAKKNNTKIACP